MFDGLANEESQTSDVVLSVRNLTTEFVARSSRVAAVRGVDFELKRGEKLGIVGESGSGKSALALSVLGLIESPGRIVAGEVNLNGRDIAALRERQLQRVRGREISLVFQDPMTSLDPVKTIGAQIVEAIRRHQPELGRAGARARAVELMQEVEIPNAPARLDDYPHQYSGGMRQRVMIAMALANNPDVLIADEPTTALDVTTQAQVLELLDRLVTEHNTAVILITHNLALVAEFCDTVLVMYAGRIVERACVEDIFSTPVHPYTEALLRSVPIPGRRRTEPLPSIAGAPPPLDRIPSGCSFAPRCSYSAGRTVCLTTEPVPAVTIISPNGPISSECHFAIERFEEKRSQDGASK